MYSAYRDQLASRTLPVDSFTRYPSISTMLFRNMKYGFGEHKGAWVNVFGAWVGLLSKFHVCVASIIL